MKTQMLEKPQLTADSLARFILNQRYQMKLWKVPQRKWKRKIFEKIQSAYGLGNVELFNATWGFLAQKGLI